MEDEELLVTIGNFPDLQLLQDSKLSFKNQNENEVIQYLTDFNQLDIFGDAFKLEIQSVLESSNKKQKVNFYLNLLYSKYNFSHKVCFSSSKSTLKRIRFRVSFHQFDIFE